jgi:hypothetical protein
LVCFVLLFAKNKAKKKPGPSPGEILCMKEDGGDNTMNPSERGQKSALLVFSNILTFLSTDF